MISFTEYALTLMLEGLASRTLTLEMYTQFGSVETDKPVLVSRQNWQVAGNSFICTDVSAIVKEDGKLEFFRLLDKDLIVVEGEFEEKHPYAEGDKISLCFTVDIETITYDHRM